MNKQKNLEIIKKDKEYKINNIAGFIEFAILMHKEGYIWFRGQRNCDWDIEPGLTRTSKLPDHNNGDIVKIRRITTSFNKAINKAAHAIKFNCKYKDIKKLKLNRIQLMMLAQHYGLITPFLDWTTNPAIALFFALDKPNDQDPKDKFSPVIYATDPKLLNYDSPVLLNGEQRYDIFNINNRSIEEYLEKELQKIEGNDIDGNSFNLPVAIDSNLDFSGRITFQSGKFTINGPKRMFEDVSFKNTLYPTHEDGHNTRYINIMAKINRSAIDDMEKYLEAFDYTKETVYRIPDTKSKLLENLFKNIQEKYNV